MGKSMRMILAAALMFSVSGAPLWADGAQSDESASASAGAAFSEASGHGSATQGASAYAGAAKTARSAASQSAQSQRSLRGNQRGVAFVSSKDSSNPPDPNSLLGRLAAWNQKAANREDSAASSFASKVGGWVERHPRWTMVGGALSGAAAGAALLGVAGPVSAAFGAFFGGALGLGFASQLVS